MSLLVHRSWTLPEIARANGVRAADYPAWIARLLDAIEARQVPLALDQVEERGWVVPVVREVEG